MRAWRVVWGVFVVAGAAGAAGAGRPEFLLPLDNITVAQGRDVHFTCIVNNLGDYKVAWIKSDTKTILAIHTLMVTQNARLAVSHNGHNTWRLYLRTVQPVDSGTYMCQVNTDPMQSQMGRLEVVVPPDIADADAGGGGGGGGASAVREGGVVELQCAARGKPEPVISWRRDAGRHIVLRDRAGAELQVLEAVAGPRLLLAGVQRADMGQYHCIASNGVPPTQSKRYDVVVLFPPTVRAVAAAYGSALRGRVTLACYVEASPRALVSWLQPAPDGDGDVSAAEVVLTEYAVRAELLLRLVRATDFGQYACSATNSLGTARAQVSLREIIPPPTTTPPPPPPPPTPPPPPPPPPPATSRPRKKVKGKQEGQGASHNTIGGGEEQRPAAVAPTAPAAPTSAPARHDYGQQRTDRTRVRPSAPPRYVTYSAAPGARATGAAGVAGAALAALLVARL